MPLRVQALQHGAPSDMPLCATALWRCARRAVTRTRQAAAALLRSSPHSARYKEATRNIVFTRSTMRHSGARGAAGVQLPRASVPVSRRVGNSAIRH